jgi:antitoxin PrlF
VEPKRRKKEPEGCCDEGQCCRIVALVSVDARGQMVLPKALREELGIEPGDKLALTTLGRKDAACLILSKANDLAPKIEELVRGLYERGPRSTSKEEDDGVA